MLSSLLATSPLVLLGLFGIFSSAAAATENVTIQWSANPEPDIVGYRLYYGTSSEDYQNTIEIRDSTSVTIPDLNQGNTYFFVMTAFNSASLESLPSEELSFRLNAPPTVSLSGIVDGAVLRVPADITLRASASDSDGAITLVEFYNRSKKLGEDTTSPYTLDLNGMITTGIHNFTARAFDNDGVAANSAPIGVILVQPDVPSAELITPLSSSDGNFRIVITSTINETFSIETSNDLLEWSTLITVTNTTGVLDITDPTPMGDRGSPRFYRVIREES